MTTASVFSYDSQGIVDSSTWVQRKNRGLLLGNSFAFGKGATNDKAASASFMNAFGRYSFLNLGIMAGNTTQELIAAIPFLPYAECVLICSGMVNLFLNLRRNSRYPLCGAFYYEDIFARFGKTDYRKLREIIQHPERQTPASEVFAEFSVETTLNLSPADLEIRFERAMTQHRRDLDINTRICGKSVPVFFALQPAAVMSGHDFTPEEKVLSDIYYQEGKVWIKVFSYAKQLWKRYTDALENLCCELGVPFADLNTLNFKGWSFADPVCHLVDNGFEQSARYLSDWIENYRV